MRLTLTLKHAITQYDAPSWLVTAIGVLLGATGIGYVFAHPEPVPVWMFEVALVSIPAASIVYGGYWVATQQLSRSDSWRIATWCLVGGGVAGALLIGYIIAERVGGGTFIEPGELVILGVLGGTVVSLYTAILNERHHSATAIGTVDERQIIDMGNEPLSQDAQLLAELVVDTRSWTVLRLLSMAEEPLGLETLVERIAAVENTDQTEVYVDLAHVRLPKLETEGLVRYESDIEVVHLSDRFTRVANANEELARKGRQLSTEPQQ
ncbi:DUF7344 domain-containing protein [Natronorubrum thiooxidans]|uniref:4TM region of histidine kinase n=1 Tax=Natronorubrum thiooxidans TaxID=308853 RepID=A0A1N7C9H6_9EURY|nr:hypothetical protein [Natronorubrum thiooxidans]SIR60232.1 4TM region of histidine kinase [Natronorubrum thiooxidans]